MNRCLKIKKRRGLLVMDVIVSITLLVILLGLAAQFHTLTLRLRREARFKDIALISASNLLESLCVTSEEDFNLAIKTAELSGESLTVLGLPKDSEFQIDVGDAIIAETHLKKVTIRVRWHLASTPQKIELVGWRPAAKGVANEEKNDE